MFSSVLDDLCKYPLSVMPNSKLNVLCGRPTTVANLSTEQPCYISQVTGIDKVSTTKVTIKFTQVTGICAFQRTYDIVLVFDCN